MELFQLLGTIAIDGSKANTEIDKVAQKADQASRKIGDSFAKVGNKMQDMGRKMAGVSMAAGAVVTAVAVGIGKSYAEYEQLVGGVETLFGKSSDRVIKYANNAYKTAGLSANQYMEQATSFSAALLQSLGGDTKAAADYADMAIRDMSDNANKMGTSMESIQDAYQGFSKSNYTMLDNLKLGYGGTKTEMERLLTDAEKIKAKHGEMADYSIDSYSDVVEAIHVVQDEMGITGTTAKESSDTISGSWNTLKSAWTNFMTEFGKSGGDIDKVYQKLEDSAKQFGNNIGDLIGRVFKNNPFLVITMGVLGFIAVLSPVFMGIGSLITIISTLIVVIPKVAAAFRILGASMMANPIGIIIALVVGLVAAFIYLWNHSKKFRNFWKGLWEGIKEIFSAAKDKIIEGFEKVKSFFTETIPNAFNTVVDFFKNNWQTILLFMLNPFAGAVKLLLQKSKGIRDAITKPIEEARDKVKKAIDKIKSFFKVTLKFKGIKMPHISVSWKSGGNLGKIASKLGLPGVPDFGVKWYRKAMDTAMLLNKPTIFGMDSAGQLLGGGEAGTEIVSGEKALMNMIKGAVSENESDPLGPEKVALLKAINVGISNLIKQNESQRIEFNGREFGRVVKNSLGTLGMRNASLPGARIY